MSAAAILPAPAEAAQAPDRGRNRITAKALDRIVSAVAAEALEVDARSVGVELGDDKGLLAVAVTSPIRVPSLEGIRAAGSLPAGTGGTVLERAAAAQESIRERVRALTGSTVGRVTVRVARVDIRSEKRVR
ncbi:hypothetical protein [Herbiconiux sp.]|uniref:hypothetical protein n=1 Tax=Herbiconiux sp. TaxID=1871186 RepID=UPI0025BECC90|nr:hypothetical protein [Herbiconiux sp.]